MRFARLYPNPPAGKSSLRWVHYRELLRVKHSDARAWYEAEAVARGWSYRRLVEAIRNNAHGKAGEGTLATVGQRPAAKLSRPREATYVYKAQVERIIDGDTVLLLIDLGFHVLKRQRVRLAEIDTAPLRGPAGQEARDFVRDTLAQVEFVVVKTNKVDLYGRYVGHIFYAPGIEDLHRIFTEGRHLNGDLLARGLAHMF